MAVDDQTLEKILNHYPAKVKRSRKKHIVIKDPFFSDYVSC